MKRATLKMKASSAEAGNGPSKGCVYPSWRRSQASVLVAWSSVSSEIWGFYQKEAFLLGGIRVYRLSSSEQTADVPLPLSCCTLPFYFFLSRWTLPSEWCPLREEGMTTQRPLSWCSSRKPFFALCEPLVCGADVGRPRVLCILFHVDVTPVGI